MSITINLNKSASQFNKGINTKEFIDQIKRRPILYDYKISHGNHEGKSNAWKEVAATLLDEKWATFSSIEREAIIKEFEMKWKSLRDYFRKYVKTVEEAKAGKKTMPKKYFYYEDLAFLANYMSTIRTLPTLSDDLNDSSSNNLDVNMSDKFKVEQIDDSTYDSDPIHVDAMVGGSTSDVGGFQFIQMPPSHHINSDSMANMSTDKRIATVLEEIANLQKEEKSDDPMGNKKFLLSLLPFMRKLPDDVNLEVRLQLMSVLQTYARI